MTVKDLSNTSYGVCVIGDRGLKRMGGMVPVKCPIEILKEKVRRLCFASHEIELFTLGVMVFVLGHCATPR